MPRLDLDAVARLVDAQGGPRPVLPPPSPLRASIALLLGDPSPDRSRSVDALDDAGLLDPAALAGADPSSVAAAIGARTDADRRRVPILQRFARWAASSGFADEGFDDSTGSIRDDLLAIRGIGAATVDALLLLGMGRPAYPLDRATFRIFVRHGWLDAHSDGDDARSSIVSGLDRDPGRLARLSNAMALIGRQYCKAGVPRCDRCPLAPLLPDGGPLGGTD